MNIRTLLTVASVCKNITTLITVASVCASFTELLVALVSLMRQQRGDVVLITQIFIPCLWQ